MQRRSQPLVSHFSACQVLNTDSLCPNVPAGTWGHRESVAPSCMAPSWPHHASLHGSLLAPSLPIAPLFIWKCLLAAWMISCQSRTDTASPAAAHAVVCVTDASSSQRSFIVFRMKRPQLVFEHALQDLIFILLPLHRHVFQLLLFLWLH